MIIMTRIVQHSEHALINKIDILFLCAGWCPVSSSVGSCAGGEFLEFHDITSKCAGLIREHILYLT